jgi:hypothetical protein
MLLTGMVNVCVHMLVQYRMQILVNICLSQYLSAADLHGEHFCPYTCTV